jgi:hypothetical protein
MDNILKEINFLEIPGLWDGQEPNEIGQNKQK